MDNPNAEKLVNILGFDPRSQNLDNSIMEEALKEIREERVTALKGRAKSLLQEAMKLVEEKKKADNVYNEQSRKFDKNLGKLMGRINAMANGKEPPKEEDEASSKEE